MNLNNVEQIIDAGGSVTDEYTRLESRWEAFLDASTNVLDSLTDAVLGDGKPDDIAHLRTLAIVNELATTVTEATVRNSVQHALNLALTREYAKTAEDNYNILRDRFNREAEAFTKAHEIVPATTDAATLVTAPEKTRKAWAEGQSRGAGLTGLVPLLVLAAELAGKRIANPQTPIGLVLDVDGLHRRRVWEAYAEGWTALLELGATIRAPRPDEYTDYREPAPIVMALERGGIGWRNIEVDPEDADYVARNGKPDRKSTRLNSSHWE